MTLIIGPLMVHLNLSRYHLDIGNRLCHSWDITLCIRWYRKLSSGVPPMPAVDNAPEADGEQMVIDEETLDAAKRAVVH